jgi:hypothetical protein
MCECENDDIFISFDEMSIFQGYENEYIAYKINFCPFCGEEVENREENEDLTQRGPYVDS